MICSVRRCEEPAVIGATEAKGYYHQYCLGHLWNIEETDSVVLIESDTDPTLATPTAPAAPAVELPIAYPEPVYNDDGFGVSFRRVHAPGVECVFPPVTGRCSCGKTLITDATEQIPSP